MLEKAVQQGRRRVETGGVPSGYVEDFDEPRTMLADFFSILLSSFHAVQNLTHFFHQHGGKRFRQEPGLTAHAVLVKHRMVRIPRHIEHFDLWSNGQDLLRDFRPAHLWHHHIRQQQMDGPHVLCAGQKGFDAMARLQYRIAVKP